MVTSLTAHFSICPIGKGGMQLWQFLYALLQEGHSDIIQYTEDDSGLEFRIIEPDAIAIWWGYQKNHQNMNFDKFSRSLRYYYERKLIQRVYGEKFVYRFCCHPEYLYEVLDSVDTRPKLKPMPLAAKLTMGQQKGKTLPDWEDIKTENVASCMPTALPLSNTSIPTNSPPLLHQHVPMTTQNHAPSYLPHGHWSSTGPQYNQYYSSPVTTSDVWPFRGQWPSTVPSTVPPYTSNYPTSCYNHQPIMAQSNCLSVPMTTNIPSPSSEHGSSCAYSNAVCGSNLASPESTLSPTTSDIHNISPPLVAHSSFPSHEFFF